MAESRENFERLVELLVDNYQANGRRSDRIAEGASSESPPRIVLVLGAQASAYAQLPGWNKDLRDTLIDEINDRLQDGDLFDDILDQLKLHGTKLKSLGESLASAEKSSSSGETALAAQRAQYLKCQGIDAVQIEMLCGILFRHKFLAPGLRRVMADRFDSDKNWPQAGPPPKLIYELIAHLLKHGFIDHIITFNFDELLDTALINEMGRDGFVKVFSDHAPRHTAERRGPRLIKLHGTASSPETMRFTFKDTSTIARGMRRHLESIFEPVDGVARKPHLISLGYSWRDRSLSQWLRDHAERLAGLTVVRRVPTTPELLEDFEPNQLDIEVLSTLELHESRAHHWKNQRLWRWIHSAFGLRHTLAEERGSEKCVELEDLVWALTDRALQRLEEQKQPVQPVSRHKILGVLFSSGDEKRGGEASERIASETDGLSPEERLKRRVKAEIVLQLAKGNGFLNINSAPHSPRIAAYFESLRNAATSPNERHEGSVTMAKFVKELGLHRYLRRSPDPEARDTFFSTAVDQLHDELSLALVENSTESFKVPHWNGRHVKLSNQRRDCFARGELKKIVESPEIEISSDQDPRVPWIFSRPEAVRSFSAFYFQVEQLLRSPWTHLFAIVESGRWIELPWIAKIVQEPAFASNRTLLQFLPDEVGLESWNQRRKYLVAEPEDLRLADRVETGRIAWWRHNRHLLLSAEVTQRSVVFHGGLYFPRTFRSTVVQATRLSLFRDNLKLFNQFLLYARRVRQTSPSGLPPNLLGELDRVTSILAQDEQLKRERIEDELIDGTKELLRKLHSPPSE